MPDTYYTQQVCLNGHSITRTFEDDGGSEYCDECGAKTIISCPNCDDQIRGRSHSSNVYYAGYIPPDKYCHSCGEAYPWTRDAINTAKELAQESTELDENDREILSNSIPDLVSESPRTKLAISRFNKMMKKVSKATYEELKDILIEYASRTTKKAIWGD